jgi:putative oxidoreductase
MLNWLVVFTYAGLFRKIAMYLLAMDLLIVSFGHGFMEPIWVSHVIPGPFYSRIVFLPKDWDRWNVDAFLKNKI